MAEPLQRLCALSKPVNDAQETETTKVKGPNLLRSESSPTLSQCCQKLFLNQIRPVQEEHKVKFNRFSLWNSFPSHKKQGGNRSVAKPSAIYRYRSSVERLPRLPSRALPGLSPALLLNCTPHPSGASRCSLATLLIRNSLYVGHGSKRLRVVVNP